MSNHVSLLLLGAIALWLTEVIIVKIIHSEEVPFWMYGIQSFAVVSFVMKIYYKW